MEVIKPVRGIIVGTDFNKLIVEANESEVAAFGRHGAVTVARQSTGPLLPIDASIVGGYLYDVNGRPVAMVQEVFTICDRVDYMSYGDSSPAWIRGPVRVEIKAFGIPGAQ